MPTPTEFEIACTKEALGDTPWPDLSRIVYKAPQETRACVRCQRPVTGDRCDHCRAHQSTYGGEINHE